MPAANFVYNYNDKGLDSASVSFEGGQCITFFAIRKAVKHNPKLKDHSNTDLILSHRSVILEGLVTVTAVASITMNEPSHSL